MTQITGLNTEAQRTQRVFKGEKSGEKKIGAGGDCK